MARAGFEVRAAAMGTQSGAAPYHLGIDLGTTYTAAAVWRDGRARMVDLGHRGPTVPSVVLLTRDGDWLHGEAAAWRAALAPDRVAREFKRRVGDSTPLVLGTWPFAAEALMARLLCWVVDEVTAAEGALPTGIAVSHPANWGAFKLDVLRRSIDRASLPGMVFVTEPEAAAIHYAAQERIEPGAVVAVYDLGGGTFDAAVLRRTVSGWQILGQPHGIESLGGIDFDEAVFRHVLRGAVGEAVGELDPDEPTTRTALARLRQDCVAAKEALAADTDVTIPVLLPNHQTEVRLTRAEFEDMIQPVLGDTLTGLRLALRSADVQPAQLDRVLLVGGSSRIPLVAQVVGSELNRPVAVDVHPKDAVALGAARVAARIQARIPSPMGGTGPAVVPPAAVYGGEDVTEVLAPADPVGADAAGTSGTSGTPGTALADRRARRRRLVALVVASGLVVGGSAAALARQSGAADASAIGPTGPAGSPATTAPATPARPGAISNVIGLPVQEARDLLAAMGVAVEVIVEPTTEGDEDGRVLNQYIPEGTEVPPGAIVTLTVGEL